jgi:integrase
MFPGAPSIQSIISSASNHRHFDFEWSNGVMRLSTSGEEDVLQAMQSIEKLKALGLLNTDSKEAPVAPPPAPMIEPVMSSVPETTAKAHPVPTPKRTEAPYVEFRATDTGRRRNLLSEEIKPFLAEIKQKKYSRTTLGQSTFTTRIFQELVGDKYVDDLNHDDIDTFMHALSVWPKSSPKKRTYRGMLAPAIVEKAEDIKVNRISLQTQQKHIDRLKMFFGWCVKRRQMKENLLAGKRLFHFSAADPKPRHPFEESDLKVLFDPEKLEAMDQPHQFWVPRFALYQGMRINEICQLYVDDIVIKDGIRGINVSRDRPGQKLKNHNSRRFLPLHPALVEAGLLRYIKDVKASGSPHLFPGLTWGKHGPGHGVGAWFNRTYLRQICGIKDKLKTFHSFRHNFAMCAINSKVSDPSISIMLGHLAGVSQLRKSYAHDTTPPQKADELAEIKFPVLNMPNYSAANFEAYLRLAAVVEKREERTTV